MVSKEGTGILTKRQIIPGAFSGGFISEDDIAKYEHQQDERAMLDNTPQEQAPQTVWEAQRSATLRTRVGRGEQILQKLEDIFIPDGFSVFVRRKPKK